MPRLERAQRVRIAHIVDSTESEGPGRRFALWVQGCGVRCPGCCNPDMFDARGGRELSVTDLVNQVNRARTGGIEGITLLGGEPMDQALGLATFAEAVQKLGVGVMLFTGYRLEQLKKSLKPGVRALLSSTDLLVDGPYVEAQRSHRRRFIGSDNQRLLFLTERYRGHRDLRDDGMQSVHVTLKEGSAVLSGWPSVVGALEARGGG